MSKHIPGEWTTSREDMDSFAVNEEGEFEHVVYVYRSDQPRIAVFAGKKNNARADARLIAAAPDLLEACKKAKQFIENGVEYGYIHLPGKIDPALDTLPQICAAIDKAKEPVT